jgi:hypothetical protein
MARPKPRAAQTNADPAPLTPAPDSGQPYAAGTRSGAGVGSRGGHKLNNRIPGEVYDALTERSERVGIRVTDLIVRALRAEARGLILPEDLVDRLQAAAEKSGRSAERLLADAVEAEAHKHGA